MEISSTKDQERIENLRKIRFRKEIIRSRIRKLKKLGRHAKLEAYREEYAPKISNNISIIRHDSVPLEVPEILSLRENYIKTCELLHSLRDLVGIVYLRNANDDTMS